MPVIRTNEEIDKLAVGETLEVLGTGHKILNTEKTNEGIRFVVKKAK
jgi:TusA-related sulfurtransferase